MGGCTHESTLLLIRSIHAFSPNWIFHSWEWGAVSLDIPPPHLRQDIVSHRGILVQQKCYYSYIDLVNDSLGIWTCQISDAGKSPSL
jgi:hypothetical protein